MAYRRNKNKLKFHKNLKSKSSGNRYSGRTVSNSRIGSRSSHLNSRPPLRPIGEEPGTAEVVEFKKMKAQKAREARRKNGANYPAGRSGISKRQAISDSYANRDRYEQTQRRRKTQKITKKVRARENGSGAAFTAIGFLLFVFVIAYLIAYTVRFLNSDSIDFEVIVQGSIDTPKTIEGVIVRDERVYSTDKSGVLSFEVSDNEKVKPGTVVCYVKDEAVVGEMEANLDKINEDIYNFQNDQRAEISLSVEDAKRINSQIKNMVSAKVSQYSYGEVSGVYDLKGNVEKKLDERNNIILTENADSLDEYSGERQRQENELSRNIASIAIENSGIISYATDGLEESLTPESLSGLTKEQTLVGDDLQAQAKSNVVSGDSIFKIVESNSWYIAAYINKNDIEGWEQKDYRKIYVKTADGDTIEFEAYVQELQSLDGECYVVFRLDKYMLEFINDRSVTIELGKPKTGFKIPKTAVVEKTLLKIPDKFVDDNSVYKMVDGKLTEVEVTISKQDSQEGLVWIPLELGKLNVGDTITTLDADETYVVSEVDNQQGIYIANSGLTEFKSINIDNAESNSTHIVIDSSKNTNIKVYDRIVTEVMGVEAAEKVYK